MSDRHLEKNHEEWKEIRTRADSIASAVFLISGGALSLSITVMLSNKASGLTISQAVVEQAVGAWYFLFLAIIIFLLLKFVIISMAYMLHFKTEFFDKSVLWFNALCWIIGIVGFVAFCWGLLKMVRAAALIIGT